MAGFPACLLAGGGGDVGEKGEGDRVLPVGASDWVRGGLWRRRHGKGRRWWLCVAGGGSPAGFGGGGRVWRLR